MAPWPSFDGRGAEEKTKGQLNASLGKGSGPSDIFEQYGQVFSDRFSNCLPAQKAYRHA